jgi:hypothetical protein
LAGEGFCIFLTYAIWLDICSNWDFYFLFLQLVSPTQYAHIYSEKLVHLPHCYFVNDYKQVRLAPSNCLWCWTWRSCSFSCAPCSCSTVSVLNNWYKSWSYIIQFMLSVRFFMDLCSVFLWLIELVMEECVGYIQEVETSSLPMSYIHVLHELGKQSWRIKVPFCSGEAWVWTVTFTNAHFLGISHVYFQKNQDVLDPLSNMKRADYGLPEDKFLFACFNQLYKMDSDVFSAWWVFSQFHITIKHRLLTFCICRCMCVDL